MDSLSHLVSPRERPWLALGESKGAPGGALGRGNGVARRVFLSVTFSLLLRYSMRKSYETNHATANSFTCN